MTKTEQPKQIKATPIERGRQCNACSHWLIYEDGEWVGHHPRNCTIVLSGTDRPRPFRAPACRKAVA